jgi:hypothetical protein
VNHLRTYFLIWLAAAILIAGSPIGAHAYTVDPVTHNAWWLADCSLATADGKLFSPASMFEDWTHAGQPTHIDDKGDKVTLQSQYATIVFWRTREACLADKAKDKAYLDTLR